MDERNKKLKLIENIDNLRVIQNNHFIVGEFNEAKKIANEIISIAKEATLLSIIEEQTAFIDEVNKKVEDKKKIHIIKKVFEDLKKKYDFHLKNKKIIEAHNFATEFKQKYENVTDLSKFPLIREFLLKDREIWYSFLEEQEKLKKNLNNLASNFQKFLNLNDLTNVRDIITQAKQHLSELATDEGIRKLWDNNEQKYLEQEENNRLCVIVDESVKEGLKLKDQFVFKEAITKIDSVAELIKNKEMIECKAKLIETRKEILAAEIKYNKLYLDLAKFKYKFRYNQENKFLFAKLRCCEKIIEIASLIGMKDLVKEFEEISVKIKLEIKDKEVADNLEQQKLLGKIKEIEKFVDVPKDVSPLIEEYSVKEILGTLSDDMTEKLEQIGTLLDDHRVTIRKEIINKIIMKTSSEQVIESEIPREVLLSSDDDNKELLYTVRSGLTNRYEDIIEEATVTDLIPYNYEIIEIERAGDITAEEPEKQLREKGLELKWRITNLKSNQKLELNYKLRRRVSRTIVFILNDILQIIKTHYNLNKLTLKGLYETKLSFKKPNKSKLEGLLFEDILPENYMFFVEEPKNISPIKNTIFESDQLFRWEIGLMDKKILKFTYKLIENLQIENFKPEITTLDTQGLEFLNKGNIIEALAKYKQIRNDIINKLK
jgi:hypothetical protein